MGVLVLLPERDRPAGDPPLLLLLDPQPPQLALLPRPPGKGRPDLSDSQDPQDFQAIQTHYWSEDSGHHFEKQPQVSISGESKCDGDHFPLSPRIFLNMFLNRELLLLTMTVSMGMLIFAGLGYALEKDEPGTMFYTLPQVSNVHPALLLTMYDINIRPQTLYWAIITMTSTGESIQ